MAQQKESPHAEFEKAVFGGYSTAAVDEKVTHLEEQLELALEKNRILEKKLTILATKVQEYQEMGDSIKDSIVKAQLFAAQIEKDAKKKADEIISDAEATSNNALASAKQLAEKRIAEYKDLTRIYEDRLAKVKVESVYFVQDMVEHYTGHIASLKAMQARHEMPPVPARPKAAAPIAPKQEEPVVKKPEALDVSLPEDVVLSVEDDPEVNEIIADMRKPIEAVSEIDETPELSEIEEIEEILEVPEVSQPLFVKEDIPDEIVPPVKHRKKAVAAISIEDDIFDAITLPQSSVVADNELLVEDEEEFVYERPMGRRGEAAFSNADAVSDEIDAVRSAPLYDAAEDAEPMDAILGMTLQNEDLSESREKVVFETEEIEISDNRSNGYDYMQRFAADEAADAYLDEDADGLADSADTDAGPEVLPRRTLFSDSFTFDDDDDSLNLPKFMFDDLQPGDDDDMDE